MLITLQFGVMYSGPWQCFYALKNSVTNVVSFLVNKHIGQYFENYYEQ